MIRIRLGKNDINKAIALTMLVLGLVSLLGSAAYNSYVAAFVGLGLTFWGALLLYIVPSKHVRLDLLTATGISSFANIERILANYSSTVKGVYLPPKLLEDNQSSLVFVPSNAKAALPNREEVNVEKLHSRKPDGIYLTPPGQALSRLFENEMGKSFTTFDLEQLQEELPKLFEELEITKNTSMHIEDDIVTFEVGRHIFEDLCEETRELRRTHEALGSPFSSAIACALAKATGKPIIVEREEQTQNSATTMRYRILEE